MRATRRQSRTIEPGACARHSVRHETQAIWDQLRDVQYGLSISYNENVVLGHGFIAELPEDNPNTTAASSPRFRVFSESVHGAMRCADTERLKFVLQSAHRQMTAASRRRSEAPTTSIC